MSRPLVHRAVDAVWLLALVLWTGGLVTLGAVVAPLVFGIVPAPTSGDAMAAVFARFDTVACVCALIVVLAEATRAVTQRPLARLDVARALAACAAAGLAIVESTAITPRIAGLHAMGAVRGSGDLGERLESLHRVAESLAKTELSALVLALVFFVWGRGATKGAPPA